MNFKVLATASALAVAAMVGSASAATLNGTFIVTAVNVTNLNSTQSQATIENFNAALDDATNPSDSFGGNNSISASDSFTYTGDLDFRVGQPQTASFSIADWLGTGTGVVGGLDSSFGEMQLSFPNINNGSATTTFFLFTLKTLLSAGEFTVTHDDGIAIYDDEILRGGRLGPVGETTTGVTGFDGGKFSLLYVATNGNPSILEVDTTAAIPLPAGGLLLLTGLGAVAFAARRRRAAA